MNDRKYIIWGIGESARQAAHCLGAECVMSFAYDHDGMTDFFLKKPVLDFDGMVKKYPETGLVIASHERDSIQNRLLMRGITEYHLFDSDLTSDMLNTPCVLFGASYIADFAFKIIPNEHIIAVCDNSPDINGTSFKGKKIISPKELSGFDRSIPVYITSRSVSSISKQLSVMGFHRHRRLYIDLIKNTAEAVIPHYVTSFDFVRYFTQCTAKPIILYGSDYVEEAVDFFGVQNIHAVCGDSLDELAVDTDDYNVVLVSENMEHGISCAFQFLHPVERMFSAKSRLYLSNIAPYYELMVRLYREKPALLRGLAVKETSSRFLTSDGIENYSPYPSLISDVYMRDTYSLIRDVAKMQKCSSFLGIYAYPGANIGHDVPCAVKTKLVCGEFAQSELQAHDSLIVSEPCEYDYTQIPYKPDLVFLDVYDEYIYLNILLRNILFNYSEATIAINNIRTDAGVLKIRQIQIILEELNRFNSEMSARLCLLDDSKPALIRRANARSVMQV